MTKEEAFELFNDFDKEPGIAMMLSVVDGEYGITITGPSPVEGETFGGLLSDLENIGYNTSVNAVNSALLVRIR